MVENNNGGTAAKCFPAGWNAAAKPCDSCNSASALLFCRKDTAFLCMACDVRLHRHTKHERVWMCEVCEQSPASVMCKADAATLCVSCDRDIHSANPLARRHERIPVVPFYNSAEAVVNSTASMLDTVSGYGSAVLNNSVPKEDNDSWAIPRDSTNITGNIPSDTSPAVMKSLDLLSASDRLFDFGFAIPTYIGLENQLHDSVNDCVVPVDTTVPTKNFPSTPIDDHKLPPGTRYEIDFTRCINNSYDKSNSQSHSRSVSSSSMDAGVVPEENSLLDESNPFMLSVNSGGMYCTKKAKAYCAVDREARVLRYREKRKNRKFEKKIRYASRKAYAEMRPRIKGRFAKRTDSTTMTTTELDVDRWLFTAENNSHSYGAEVEYGVVPSFWRTT